ncbi:hypothetical protein B0H15DRAFT_958657 [Mycena belliarum]|uniref:Uncharacterized protein n=1 Tax=Mycena belliarum TaxID=1033014 RepID=A0AAD6TK61_9AGAR|nr:hypothetical protein B0H15DRAFT_958657 [Mycena belliae]
MPLNDVAAVRAPSKNRARDPQHQEGAGATDSVDEMCSSSVSPGAVALARQGYPAFIVSGFAHTRSQGVEGETHPPKHRFWNFTKRLFCLA